MKCFAAVVIWALVFPAANALDEVIPAHVQEAANAEPKASIEELTERVRKSLVVITTSSRDNQREAVGSGFVIGSDGLIATNFHVIGEARAVRVQLADGRQLEASAIHAFNRQLDLAIIRVDAKDLPVLELGDSDAIKQGQGVLALGNPQGLKHSVVSGVVSSVREMEGRQMIQLAIPIEPGNSGGPLVDMQGRVQGILTMKSAVTANLGFALTINTLKPLVAKPNPIPMTRWLTIGALHPRDWTTLFGSRWRQRAGRITVEGAGQGFGGRSLCLSRHDVPERPFEISVTVHLNDESGAAGLAFCSDGANRHYGFYPTAGRLRLTRFDGADILSWTILHDQPSRDYVAGGWNILKVRVENEKVTCYCNDKQIVELKDGALAAGKVGLVKFRDTRAEFKNFRLGRELPPARAPEADAERISDLVRELPERGEIDSHLVEALAEGASASSQVLRQRASQLESQASQLKHLAQAAHELRTTKALAESLAGEEDQIDLFRAGLLVARLDNEELDVDAYGNELADMAREIASQVPADAGDVAKLEVLRKYLFEENGFHGSRGDYYSRANSYLNEVLDDREGLPITLSIVYMELAKRIGLKIVGIGLPGHFVVEHRPAEGQPQLLDVFDGATSLSREEANKHVKDNIDRDLTDDDLKPLSKRAIVARMLHNLLGTSGNDPRSAHRYLNAILAIQPASSQHHWLRAVVRYQLQQSAAALEDVGWLLENKPLDVEPLQVLNLQRAIQRQQGQ